MSKKSKAKPAAIQAETKPEFDAFYYFPSPVYVAKKPEFLEVVSEVSEEALQRITRDVHEIYPMHNTESFADDPRLVDFIKYPVSYTHLTLPTILRV